MARNTWDLISQIPSHVDSDYRRHAQEQVDEYGRSRAGERASLAKQAIASMIEKKEDEAAEKAAIEALKQLGITETQANVGLTDLRDVVKRRGMSYPSAKTGGKTNPTQQNILDALREENSILANVKFGEQTLAELENSYAANAIDNAPWWDPAANLARTQRAMATDDAGGVIARYGIPAGATLGTIALIDAMARLGDPASIAVVERMPER